MKDGTIVIKLEDVSLVETERFRQIIHKLIQFGVFNVRNGKAILNFDNTGSLADIELQIKTWNRRFENEPIPQLNSFEQFTISTTPIDNSSVTKRI